MADGKAEHYEFDAPCHVVDLKELVNSENDDKWFEQHDGAADGHLFTPCRPDQLFLSGDDPSAPVIRQVQTDVDSGPSRSTSPPSNSVASCSAETRAKNDAQPVTTTNQLPPQPRRVSKHKDKITTGPAALPSKKYKRSPMARKSRSERGTAHEPHPATTSSANTLQSIPEEEELEHIRNLQEVALHRRRNKANYKAALAGEVPPKKMILPTTVQKDFKFSTDTHAQASTSSNTSHKVVDFTGQLRKPSSPAKARKGTMVPKPCGLSTGKKRKVGKSDVYVPMAQQVEQFQKRTPTRYRLHSRKSQERAPPREKSTLKLTQPHPPHQVTQQRSHPPPVKSSADLEAEEVEKLQNFKLKALELNKILESAEDLKKPAVKEPTVPECSQLETEKSLQERQVTKKPQEEEPHNFKILEGVVGEQGKRALEEKRLEERQNEEVKEEQTHQEEAAIFKAKPNTVTQKEPFQPKKEDRPELVVEAFELATERRAGVALWVRMEGEQQEEKEEQRERQDIAKLRKEQVHRVPKVPKSANFSSRFRL